MTSTAGKPANTFTGLESATVEMACFATLDSLTKYVSASVPVVMVIWFCYAVQAALVAAVVLPLRGSAVLRTARGVLLLSTSLLAFLTPALHADR